MYYLFYILLIYILAYAACPSNLFLQSQYFEVMELLFQNV
jgi:hypothetical protein